MGHQHRQHNTVIFHQLAYVISSSSAAPSQAMLFLTHNTTSISSTIAPTSSAQVPLPPTSSQEEHWKNIQQISISTHPRAVYILHSFHQHLHTTTSTLSNGAPTSSAKNTLISSTPLRHQQLNRSIITSNGSFTHN